MRDGGIDGYRDIDRSIGRGGAGLCGVRTFADGVQGGDDIEVGRAIGQPGVEEAWDGDQGDLRVRPAGGGAAFDVVAGSAGAGSPRQRDLCVAGRGGQASWRGGSLRGGDRLGAGFRGVGTLASRVYGGDDVEIGGAVGEASVGETGRGGRRDGCVRSAAGGAALHVIAGGACANCPDQADLRVSWSGGKSGRDGWGGRAARVRAAAWVIGIGAGAGRASTTRPERRQEKTRAQQQSRSSCYCSRYPTAPRFFCKY